MSTSYPTAADSFTTKVDNVDTVYAADINNVQDSISALETRLGITSTPLPTIIDTDVTLAANSDTKISSQKAVKTYSDSGTQTLTNKTLISPVIKSWDGWQTVSDSWTYASSSTINVPSGAASLYQIGDKIKITQTTNKYFYVIAVADTLLTVTGGSDYTVANEAITAKSYSHIENPLGFPAFFDYVPVLTTTGGPVNSYTVNSAKFTLVKKLLITYLNITINNNGTGSGAVNITSPITINDANISGRIAGTTGKVLGAQGGAGGFQIFNYDNTYPLATNAVINAQIFSTI